MRAGFRAADDVLLLDGVPVEASARELNGHIVVVSGTSYTLQAPDAGALILCMSGSATSIIVPPYASVPFRRPTLVSLAQMGAGAVTIVAGSNVTISTPETLVLAKRYASATLTFLDVNAWLAAGYLTAA